MASRAATRQNPGTWLLRGLASALLVGIGSAIFTFANRGLELSDEGSYLAWCQDPSHYKDGFSLFGYVLHPLFKAVGYDVAAFRTAGGCLLLLAAVAFVTALTRRFGLAATPQVRAAATAATASIWGYYALWLPTPSYNWLTLFGLLVFWTGLLGDNAATAARKSLAASVAGGGWFCIAVARPPAALAALFLAFGWQRVGRPEDETGPGRTWWAIAGSSALALAIGLVARHPEIPAVLANGWKLAGWTQHSGYQELGSLLGLIASIPFEGARALLDLLGLKGVSFGNQAPLWAIGFVGITLWRRNAYWPAVLLALTPLVYAFSTNNDLLSWSSGASIFFAAAVLLAMFDPQGRPVRASLQWTFTAFAFGLPALAMASGQAHPYRLDQPIPRQAIPAQVGKKLGLQSQAFAIGPSQSPLQADAPTRAYLGTLISSADAHGFRPGTPLIDLTGHCPGVAWALGGLAPTTPWLFGGYPHSRDYAVRALRLDAADLPKAWILVAPVGRRRLDPTVLDDLGLDFPAHYALVATVSCPWWHESHELWRPAP
ncbi:MAG: hypothetical protein KGR26_00980 [Cyanobacteria bacterium REEB65]|nr:hypothetical protein [Cyanobacteria bacterium REEB65]